MASDWPQHDMRVLLLAPTARDGDATRALLTAADIQCLLCRDLEHLCREIALGTAALMVPEEVLAGEGCDCLAQTLRSQPVWSDLAVIILSRAAGESPAVERALATLGSVSVVERPMRVNTFLSVVRTALRARERQYQVRDYLDERARVEQTLARDAILLSNVSDSVIMTDLDGVITYWNQGAVRLFGFEASEMIGRHLTDRLPQPSRSEMAGWITKIAAGETEFRGEWLDYRKDGSPIWIDATTRRINDPSGKPLGIMGVAHDITERRRAEEALRERTEEVSRANASKDEFLAVLSHELRTPLTPVLLTVSLMENNPALPEVMRDDVATIRRNVELESRLISDLLDLTRIEKGKLQLDIQDVDLHLVVRAAIDICQREASARLHVDLAAKRHVVQGDSTRLQQVFWNLINNAIKFTGPEGDITVRSSNLDNGRIRVEVTDSGVGIDPEVLPKLFAAFEQGEVRAVRLQAGLGLGLSISRRLVELHGGTIAGSSGGRGQGATFAVELQTADTFAAPSVTRPAPAPPAMRPLNVLLVEDHETTLNVMTRLLRSLGHTVTGTTSAASATAAARQNGFDLMICDLGLPDGSGLDVMRHVRDKYHGRGIALTGYGMESDVAASREAGFAEHLTKPIDLAQLERTIRRVVEKNKP